MNAPACPNCGDLCPATVRNCPACGAALFLAEVEHHEPQPAWGAPAPDRAFREWARQQVAR